MKVSVIVVTLNEEKNIIACLDSLCKQKKVSFEVIIVDGGSKDRTQSLVKGVAKKYKNVSLVVKENGSITQCRNLGIKKAKYEFIAFTDADCIAPEDWLVQLQKGYIRIQKNTSNLAGVGGANIPPLFGNSFQQAIGIAFDSLLGSLGSIQAKKMTKDQELFSISCSNSFYKKAVLEEVGMFSEELENQGEDWDLGAKLQQKNYCVYGIPESFVWHNFRVSPHLFWRNMVFYGDGRMRLTKKYPKLIKIKYTIPLFFIPTFVVSILLYMLLRNPFMLVPYLYFPAILLYSIVLSIYRPLLMPKVFLAFIVQHFGYALGELKGLRWVIK